MLLPIQSELRSITDPEKARLLSRFFKTGPGQYGEWDCFLGIKVPDTRRVVKKYLIALTPTLSQREREARSFIFKEIQTLLDSLYHEERLAGVLILVEFAKRKTFPLETIAKFYMAHTDRINNWDLVDTSAGYIIGPYLAHCLSESDREVFIEKCIASEHLWTNRIIILASLYFIVRGDANMILAIAPRFFPHRHDLIHKAAGWMLREAGKRVSDKLLCDFLDIHAGAMPRTMLRYAIERLSEEKRKRYMQAGKSS